jgi:multidrug efflux pump subunit AcrB
VTPRPFARGPIALFARHPTAGNLLMVLMLLAGLVGILQLNRQFFPDFGIDAITVSVAWPGATAEDVEANIVEAIEPEVRFLDGVDRVIATARENLGTVIIEFVEGTDMQKALAEVEQAIAQITTFPADAEEPRVRRVVRYDTIARLVLSGPYSEPSLRAIAEDIRDRLLAAGIDKVTLFGVRDQRLLIELEPARLHQLGLTIGEIAERLERSAVDLPGGDIPGALERRPRTLGLARDAAEVGELTIETAADGRRLTVADIAQVSEGFVADEPEGRRRDMRAIELHVQRSLTADVLEVSAILDRLLAELATTLPADLSLERYDVLADLVRDRIALLLENGFSGFLLVLLILFLFLNGRVAFWVAVGIPVSLGAMLGVMWFTGQSINMISLFAMILAIGIVVDDAIVVGEHAVSLRERGLPPELAAENGARRMVAPVTSATLTTIVAFLPLLVIGGIIGQVIRDIPLVVAIVLLASLVECMLVLPSHLRHALARPDPLPRFRERFDRGFARLRDGPVRRLVTLAVLWRYTTIALAVGALLLVGGLLAGGRIGFVFFQGPESDRIEVSVRMMPGTPRSQTESALRAIELALHQAAADLGSSYDEIVVMSFARLAEQPQLDPGAADLSGDTVGGLEIELIASDSRPIRTDALIAAWTARLPPIAGLDDITIRERSGGPPGREVDIRLRGGDSVEALKQAARDVRALLARLPGVSQVADDLPWGTPEIVVEPTPAGLALGFDAGSIGRQLRDAFEGRVAYRFARASGEVEVMVRLDPNAVRDIDPADLLLVAPDGREVRLGEVAELRERNGFALIRREDGAREVAITAELDESQIRLEQVQELLAADLERVARTYGLTVRYAGRAEEQAETLADMRLGTLIALGLIYIVLAWVFGSFARPLAVMSVIPFGLIGAVLGHLLLGYNLTIMSLISLLGLSGVLVNDSIILVRTIDDQLQAGGDPLTAIVEGTCSRLRAVLLTSLTTIGGLAPLLFETSFQAQFLIPMAVTLVFGLAVNTILVLLIVPALVAIETDFRRGSLGQRQVVRRVLEPAA